MCIPAITSPTLFIIPTRVTARCRTSTMRALPGKCMGALHAVAKKDIVLVSVGHDVLGQAWPAYQSMSSAQLPLIGDTNKNARDPDPLEQPCPIKLRLT